MGALQLASDKWYKGGLGFACAACGNCCTGAPGYVWVTREEIRRIARYLQRDDEWLPPEILRRAGFKYSLTERNNGDCVFLEPARNGRRGCRIYPVRPLQCRTWPFWTINLKSPSAWAETAESCPGMNNGRKYSFDEIEGLRLKKDWEWAEPFSPVAEIWPAAQRADVIEAMRSFYAQTDRLVAAHQPVCRDRGRCCRFGEAGHRLYVTTMEVAYYLAEGPLCPPVADDACPHAYDGACHARDRRFLSCRVFFCDPASQAWQGPLIEERLTCLRRLHEELRVPYSYADWMRVLARLHEKPVQGPPGSPVSRGAVH